MTTRKHRTALAAVAVCVGFGAATAGCGSAGSPGHSLPARIISPLTGSPQTQAEQAARALLAAFDALPGASVSAPASPEPAGLPSASLTAQWTVDAASGAAFTEAEAHLPDWGTAGSATQPPVEPEGRNSRSVQESSYGAVAQESVSITTVPLGPDRSTLQVWAQALWRPAKPATEQLPDSPVLLVSEQLAQPPAGAPQNRTVTLTDPPVTLADPTVISLIASQIDGLPTEPEFAPAFCPEITELTLGGSLTLDFRDTAGRTLAKVQTSFEPSGRCGGWVEVSVGGAVQPRLDDDADPRFAARIAALAGLPGPPSS